MKKILKYILISLLLLSGCSKQPQAEIRVDPKEQETEIETWSYQGKEPAYALEKKEVVTVSADVNGKPQKIEAAVTLSDIQGNGPVKDMTSLNNLNNKKGDEEYTFTGDALYWQNLGKEISYEGKSDAPLPVEMTVRYVFNGEEVSPESILGKSGTLEVFYSFTNKTRQAVTSDGYRFELPVPFVTMTAVLLPEGVFSNIETDNATLSSLDGQKVIIGMTFPGLQNSLRGLQMEGVNEIELVDSFSFKAEVSGFETGYSTTIISSGIFADMDQDFSKFDDLKNGMIDLKDASAKLLEAAGKIHDGVSEYRNYLKQYFDGVDQLDAGLDTFNKGLGELDKQKEQLQQGADALSTALNAVVKALEDSSSSLDGLKEAAGVLSSLQEDLGTLLEFAAQLPETAKQFEAAGNEFASYIAKVEAVKVAFSGYDLSKLNETARSQSEQALRNALEGKLSEEEIEAVIAKNREAIDLGSETELQGLFAQLADLEAPDLSGMQIDLGPVEEARAGLGEETEALAALSESASQLGDLADSFGTLTEQLKQIRDGAAQLAGGVKAFNEGIGKLNEGASALKKGSAALAENSDKLLEGLDALLDGTKEYEEGYAKFHKEGIIDLSKIGTRDLPELQAWLKAVRKADQGYSSYTGLEEHQKGSTVFVIETEELTK